MTSQPLFQNTFTLREPRVAYFYDIIKIATMCIKTVVQNSKIVKGIRNYILKCNVYLYFLLQQKYLITVKKR